MSSTLQTPPPVDAMAAAAAYREELLAAGLLVDTGVDGLYGRSQVFESVIEAIDAAFTRMSTSDGAEVLRFPPLLTRTDFMASGYMKSFPQLAGTVQCFCGNDADHRSLMECVATGKDFSNLQQPAEVVLTPAACYPVYPVMSRRGNLPAEGKLVDVFSYCFRHEPSLDPGRMQMFRMREQICLGTGDQVLAFRERWLERGLAFVGQMALPGGTDIANDPFFGRSGRLMASGQREQKLKFEMLIPITSTEKPTACISFNYHMDHFAHVWSLHDSTGADAHTGCVGFGMERLTLALFRYHGFDPKAWPAGVRNALWPQA